MTGQAAGGHRRHDLAFTAAAVVDVRPVGAGRGHGGDSHTGGVDQGAQHRARLPAERGAHHGVDVELLEQPADPEPLAAGMHVQFGVALGVGGHLGRDRQQGSGGEDTDPRSWRAVPLIVAELGHRRGPTRGSSEDNRGIAPTVGRSHPGVIGAPGLVPGVADRLTLQVPAPRDRGIDRQVRAGADEPNPVDRLSGPPVDRGCPER